MNNARSANVFDVSFGELLLIAVVALVVIGPERLPGAARTAGALLRRVRRGWDSVRAEVTRELEAEELRAKLREAQDAARAAMADVREQANATTESLGAIAQDARNVMRPIPQEADHVSTNALPANNEAPSGNRDDRAG